MSCYFSNHYKNVTYPIHSTKKRGLRNAQIGAIHSISSFFTLNTRQAAIIVMPTGAGKTAVLMLTPYVLMKNKVLIVTPSVMVRGQISEDYAELSTLCKANVFNERMRKPIVYELIHKYCEKDEVAIKNADVIIATPQCALSLSETEWAKENIDLVEVDEAHHTPAKTWQQILINLKDAEHVLFTATPFRLDKKEITGEIVYDYPLSKAYSDGIFGEIQFIPICATENKDLVIAKKAEEVLISDRDMGLKHYLMVRTENKKNAVELENLYSENTSLKLKRIDSSMSSVVVKKCIKNLRDGVLDGIICVDMLGEGFDFPNLKIAAVHVPHKSLASTLQFIGRFARTNAKDIGTAKFIAANDEELEIENNKLYASDAVWQDMIIDMSEEKTQKEFNMRKYYKTYETELLDRVDNFVPIQSIVLNCHTRIYRATGFEIYSSFPENLNVANRVYRNKDDNTVIGIGIDFVSPIWLGADYKINKQFSLYVIHYQKEIGLLHIYSQSHTEQIYELLASTYCSSYEKVQKYEMNRVLGNMNGFEIFNSGMVNRFNESGEAYRIMAGSDVSNAIDPSTGKMFSAGHVFCKANENIEGESETVTVGYSSASKVWSSTYSTLPEYISWCDHIGHKIVDSKIHVKTNTNYDYVPMPKLLEKYPNNIFFTEFASETFMSSPIVREKSEWSKSYRLSDFKLLVENQSEDKIRVKIYNDEMLELVQCDLQGRYTCLTNNLIYTLGAQKISIADYLNNHKLSFRTLDDALISGAEIYEGNAEELSFDQSSIEVIDWEKYKTDTSLEFRKKEQKGVVSIQDALKIELVNSQKYKYVIYDHGSGEIADFITISETETTYNVELYHVKKKSSENYNSSVGDIYEVAGQAVKSIIWLTTKGKFADKLASRRKSGHCQIVYGGEYKKFIHELRKSTKQMVGYIFIVQPGLSQKAVEMPVKIQEVLAASSNYIRHAGKVKGLKILGSK